MLRSHHLRLYSVTGGIYVHCVQRNKNKTIKTIKHKIYKIYRVYRKYKVFRAEYLGVVSGGGV
jgi:hypothetical protein